MVTEQEYWASKGAVSVHRPDSNAGRGIPMGSYSTQPEIILECQETNKRGMACKAHPVKGTSLCQGHTKQVTASG